MRNRGYSLVELVAVLGLIATMLSIASLEFHRWQLKSNIEKQINEMYVDITEARQLALNTRQARTITFSANSLVFKRYTSDADLESGQGIQVKTKTLNFPISFSSWADPSSNPSITASDILFTSRGIMDQPTVKSFCVNSGVDPSLDAIVIAQSRIAVGKIKTQGAGCGTSNIDIK